MSECMDGTCKRITGHSSLTMMTLTKRRIEKSSVAAKSTHTGYIGTLLLSRPASPSLLPTAATTIATAAAAASAKHANTQPVFTHHLKRQAPQKYALRKSRQSHRPKCRVNPTRPKLPGKPRIKSYGHHSNPRLRVR